MGNYHYKECGLDNVIIEGMKMIADDAGEDTVTIPAVGELHAVIAEGIVSRSTKMSGRELRFLRTEMGLTQENLADVLKVSLLTIGRWEREESGIKDAAEMLIRLMANKNLNLQIIMDVDTVSSKVNPSPRTYPIRIDGSIPGHYHLMAA